MTHPDFRALCAELVKALEEKWDSPRPNRLLMDRAHAALAAPQQGAPSDQELRELAWKLQSEAKDLETCGDVVVQFARAVLTRYGAQAVPVAAALSNICTGCDTPRHEAITAIANGAMACCPDCSTLTVEDRNAIRAIKAVAVAVAERLPGEGDCMANPRNGEGLWCWAWIQHDPSLFAGRWRMMRREWLAEEATHWLPWNSISIPSLSKP